jgi:hypothetical protein
LGLQELAEREGFSIAPFQRFLQIPILACVYAGVDHIRNFGCRFHSFPYRPGFHENRIPAISTGIATYFRALAPTPNWLQEQIVRMFTSGWGI